MAVPSSPVPPERIAALALPQSVLQVIETLQRAGHQAYAVGGGLRDLLFPQLCARALPQRPPDWDVATSATPPEVQRLFQRTIPVGLEHGTVTVHQDKSVIEVTTFRADVETYGRKARVRFSRSLQEDLERRDFTINAIAFDPVTRALVDPFHGVEDMGAGILRTVGEPGRRFQEDYLRLLRGARFAARFDLTLAPGVEDAMREHASGTRALSGERVRDELMKTFAQAAAPSRALELLRDTGVLREILPELDACFRVEQNRWHADDVGTHILHTIDAVSREHPFLRMVALLHDIGKPAARVWDASRQDFVFRGHDEIGARMAREVLERLRFSSREIERAVHLVAVHMDLFPAEAGDAAVRRWLQRVGEENVRDLFRLHFADWRGNRAKPQPPSELRALYRRARGVQRQASALKIRDLAIGGDDLRGLGLEPGPIFSVILNRLLERVVEDPALNERERLLREAVALIEGEAARGAPALREPCHGS